MQSVDILMLYPYKNFLESSHIKSDIISEPDYTNILNLVSRFIEKQNIALELPPLISSDEYSTLLSFRMNYTPKEAANFSWLLTSQLVEKDLDKSNLLITFVGYKIG